MKFAPSVTNAVDVLFLEGSPGQLLWLKSIDCPGGRGRGPEDRPPSSEGKLHVERQLLSLSVLLQHQLSVVLVLLLLFV